ncbi:MAG: TonB-dependent receptor domain-containing protein [Asticcacaulis sp.]
MKTQSRLLLSTAVGVVAASAVAPVAFAQTSGTPAAAPVQEVVVTGSRIRRNPANAPAPLIQVTRDEFLQSGQPNIIDQLADIPALSGSVVPEDTTGSNLNDGGLSLLNLRNLGSARTLVLVDSKRHVGAPQGSLSVDVDSIPRLLVDRVDITTGGQSALYGADAVSGVVNYIMKKNFQGVEVDGSYAQINQNGETQSRLSALVGHNFFDDRLNVYFSAEYEKGEEVKDANVDWRQRACSLITVDADPNAQTPDGVLDNQLVCGLRNLSRPYGGLLVVASGQQPSPATDPDIAFFSCTTSGFSSNCFFPNPGNAYVFAENGTASAANFGTRPGTSRFLTVGGDGLNINTQFSQGSRVPSTEAQRFQAGLNFKFSDNITGYVEAKYVKEETFDAGQGSFFNIGISPVSATAVPTTGNATSAFNIGLDNAYLPANIRTQIQNNVRTIYNSAGAVTGTIADPRALFTNFGPLRNQTNVRTVQRYVASLKGDHDNMLFFNNVSWELSYTHGELENKNNEFGLDVIRYKHGADAVVDTAGIVNGKAGEIVCRVQLLAKQGVAIPDGFRGGNYDPNHPEIKGCVPFNLFGEGGQNGAAARKWFDASIDVTHTNIQDNAMAFFGGELWDFWGAGAIATSFGIEWRKEQTEGVGRTTSTGDRLLFLNTGADFKKAQYETKEAFAELRIPLLKDMRFAKNLEVSGAVRTSDYSTVGKVDTYSFQALWRVNDELMFRYTRGLATRIPNLSENFAPLTQTFANGFVDPCDALNIQNTTDPVVRANRTKNCAAIGIPTGQRMTYTGGVPGFNGGNPQLKPENSLSRTVSVIMSPKFLPRTQFVFDFYNIEISDVISSISAQTLANQCVSQAEVNARACALITRNPADQFKMSSFLQGSLNYAKFETQGVDFTFNYRQPLDNVFGKDLGNMRFSLRGNYEFFNREYTNIDFPNLHTDYTQGVGLPNLRVATTVAWNYKPTLSFFWNMDIQGNQEIADIDLLRSDSDNREVKFLTTGKFVQHDFSVRWEPRKNLTLRAGVVNAFDEEPAAWLGNTSADNLDLFGRRFYVGFNYKH